jgi:hypothetical protein
MYIVAKFLALWLDAVSPCLNDEVTEDVALTFEVDPDDGLITLGVAVTFEADQDAIDCLSENIAELGW